MTSQDPNALLRLSQIVPAMLPISKSSFWNWVKAGRLPAGIKIGPRVTCWRRADIIRLAEREGRRTETPSERFEREVGESITDWAAHERGKAGQK